MGRNIEKTARQGFWRLLVLVLLAVMLAGSAGLTAQAAQNGWTKAPNGSVYYYRNGKKVTGWLKLGNKTYYLDPRKGGARVTGRKVIRKKGYYFFVNLNGRMATSQIIRVNSKTSYYAFKSGILAKGLMRTGGYTYYFSKSDNKMKFGWIKTGGKTYYMRLTGNVKTKGAAVTGWMKKNNKRYYFDANGRMVTGLRTIGGRQYYFNPKTGESVVGTVYINGRRYTFGQNGIPVATSKNYVVKVNRKTCTVTVYRGGKAVKAFACSVGLPGTPTPAGTFKILDHLRWHELMGPSWGQWCSHITYSILFHSIPYQRPNKYSMPASAYNKLGKPASHGCIRLAAGDSKYIYDNVPIGSNVIVFDGTSRDDPLGKPMPPYCGSWWHSYDPTDPTV